LRAESRAIATDLFVSSDEEEVDEKRIFVDTSDEETDGIDESSEEMDEGDSDDDGDGSGGDDDDDDGGGGGDGEDEMDFLMMDDGGEGQGLENEDAFKWQRVALLILVFARVFNLTKRAMLCLQAIVNFACGRQLDYNQDDGPPVRKIPLAMCTADKCNRVVEVVQNGLIQKCPSCGAELGVMKNEKFVPSAPYAAIRTRTVSQLSSLVATL